MRLGEVELSPYGLLQLDQGGTFDQSRDGGQGTGFNPRRARLGAQATVADQLELGFVWDFGGTPGNRSRLFGADVAYTGLDPFVLRAGVFKPAFTLEYAPSAADILFLERASIVNIVGGLVAGAGRVGGQVGAAGERWLAAASGQAPPMEAEDRRMGQPPARVGLRPRRRSLGRGGDRRAAIDRGSERRGRTRRPPARLDHRRQLVPAEPLRLVLEYQHADIAGGQAPRSLDAVALRGQVRF